MDQKIASFTSKNKSAKWTRCSLWFVLDTAWVNATTLFATAKDVETKKVDCFEIGWDLAQSLVLPVVTLRPVQGLSRSTQLRISLFSGNEPQQRFRAEQQTDPLSPGMKRRCKSCVDKIVGKPGDKERKSALKKVKSLCSNVGVLAV